MFYQQVPDRWSWKESGASPAYCDMTDGLLGRHLTKRSSGGLVTVVYSYTRTADSLLRSFLVWPRPSQDPNLLAHTSVRGCVALTGLG